VKLLFLYNLGGELSQMQKNEVWKVWLEKEFILVGFWLSQVWWIRFFCLVRKSGEQMKLWFLCNLGGELSQMHQNEVWKVFCKRNWSWLGFGLPKFGGLGFFALVAKLVNKWSYGFCALLVGNCQKCIKNEVWKVWLQTELILVGFWLSQVRWIGFCCLGSKIGE